MNKTLLIALISATIFSGVNAMKVYTLPVENNSDGEVQATLESKDLSTKNEWKIAAGRNIDMSYIDCASKVSILKLSGTGVGKKATFEPKCVGINVSPRVIITNAPEGFVVDYLGMKHPGK